MMYKRSFALACVLAMADAVHLNQCCNSCGDGDDGVEEAPDATDEFVEEFVEENPAVFPEGYQEVEVPEDDGQEAEVSKTDEWVDEFMEENPPMIEAEPEVEVEAEVEEEEIVLEAEEPEVIGGDVENPTVETELEVLDEEEPEVIGGDVENPTVETELEVLDEEEPEVIGGDVENPSVETEPEVLDEEELSPCYTESEKFFDKTGLSMENDMTPEKFDEKVDFLYTNNEMSIQEANFWYSWFGRADEFDGLNDDVVTY